MTRAYGWTPNDELVPHEAAMLRVRIAEVAAKKSMKQIVRELNDAATPTAAGSGEWSIQVLKRILVNPRMIGRKADSLGRPIWKGEPVYPPVCRTPEEIETWQAARKILLDRRRLQKRNPDDIALMIDRIPCGLCGKQLHATAPQGRNPRYACHVPTGGCGRVSISMTETDDYMTGEVLDQAAHVVEPPITEVQAARWWKDASNAERRELVAGLVDHVMVYPRTKDRAGTDRLEILWSAQPAWPKGLT